MRIVKGRVWFRGRLESLSLGIDEDGRIAVVRKILRGDDLIDHGEALILPGCVDMHVHMRDPGLTEKEDFPSGTRSAAIGGVTTVADMPNTRPPVTDSSALERKIRALQGRAMVDYAIYAAPPTGNGLDRFTGAIGFKVYLAETTGELRVDLPAAQDILASAQRDKRPVVVHAEDPQKFARSRMSGLRGHSNTRPEEAEASAIAAVARLRGTAATHVAHVTNVGAMDAIPSGITTEVAPHHLFLDFSKDLGTFGKVNPPLRSPESRNALWEAFRSGRCDVVASDHAPHTAEEKQVAFDEAPAGVPGVATSLPLLMRRARAGDLSLERIVTAMASRPAELLGIAKGAIEIGRDADLIVVDPRATDRITAKRVRYKCGWTPFDGMEGSFPQQVYLRGEAIVEDGEPVGDLRGHLLGPGGT
jgi:dihydroorotase